MMTDNDKALVERLREEADEWDEPKSHDEFDMRGMLHSAADRIEQLKREKAVVSDLWEQQKEIALDYLADCNALSAENERLRMHLDVALETLAEEGVCGDECNTCKEARAALGETE